MNVIKRYILDMVHGLNCQDPGIKKSLKAFVVAISNYNFLVILIYLIFYIPGIQSLGT